LDHGCLAAHSTVITIALIVDKRFPPAVRFVAPPDVLEHVHVAAAREVDTGFIRRRKPLGAIRRSGDDDWMALVPDRPIHIRIQRHPVAHRDRHPVVEQDIVAFRHVGRRESHGCRGLDSRRGSLRDGDENQEWKQEQGGASAPCHEDTPRFRTPAAASDVADGRITIAV